MAEVLGRPHRSLHQHNTRTLAVLAIADDGAFFRGDDACCILLFCCGWLIGNTCFHWHTLLSFLVSLSSSMKGRRRVCVSRVGEGLTKKRESRVGLLQSDLDTDSLRLD